MVTKGEDEQSVGHVQRSQPTRIKLSVGEERLHEDEQEESHRQSEDGFVPFGIRSSSSGFDSRRAQGTPS
jgi:hypothetical protein